MAEIEGYIVAGYEHGVLVEDWDGTVHTSREAGERALSECHAAGYEDWELYELRPVSDEAAERRRAADTRRLDAVRRLLHTTRKTLPVEIIREAITTAPDAEVRPADTGKETDR